MAEIYKFELQGYLGSIQGINGSIMPVDDNNNPNKGHPLAESSIIELTHKETLQLWRKNLRKEELNGVVLKEMHHFVKSIQNALDVECTNPMKISVLICEETPDSLSITLTFPCILGPVSQKITLEEVVQDEVSILTQRVSLLSGRTRDMELNQTSVQDELLNLTQQAASLTTEMQHNEAILTQRSTEMAKQMEQNQNKMSTLQQQMDSLTDSMTEMENKERIFQESKFVRSGTDLHISKSGKIITKKSDGCWRTAVIGDSMSSGKHHVEFMTLRMTTSYNMTCGVVPANSELNNSIGSIPGGFRIQTRDGIKRKNDESSVATTLPGCNGSNGTAIVGVLLDLEDNKYQFSFAWRIQFCSEFTGSVGFGQVVKLQQNVGGSMIYFHCSIVPGIDHGAVWIVLFLLM